MEKPPRITYSRTVNLGDYNSEKLELSMDASSNTIEEIDAMISFAMAAVQSSLGVLKEPKNNRTDAEIVFG